MRALPKGRLVALDAFRGMAIAAMILVNNPGSWDNVYPQLLHTEWIGWTFTDLIFPCFLFIAGVAMWFSFKKFAGAHRWDFVRKILLRATLIFLVGLFISWFPFYHLSFENLRFVGVLQRIAVSYVIASLMCVMFRQSVIAVLAMLLLLGYWLLIVQVGGEDHYSREVLRSQGIDLISFRSCISSAVPIMIGFLVGSYIDRPDFRPSVMLPLVGTGIVMILIGAVWSQHFPIIKDLLWSSSYVVFAVGFSIVAFSICFWIIKAAGMTSWAIPFVHIGLNPLFLYALSILLDKLTWIIKIGGSDSSIPVHSWVYQNWFEPLAGPVNGSLMYAVCFLIIHWLIAYGLYKRQIFVKV